MSERDHDVFLLRPQVSDVFTPRRPEVNQEIYVDRPDLQTELRRALLGSMHVVVTGESGSGKSWLYKKVLADMASYVAVANCGNADRLASVTQEIVDAIVPAGTAELTSYDEGKEAKVKAIFAEGDLSHSKTFEIKPEEPLLRAFRVMRKAAGHGRLAVLVLDNLEAIFPSIERMRELANIILLLDDTRYAQFAIKILIVGTPARIRDYFSKTPMLQPVGNRLHEVEEVGPLSSGQVETLVTRGFFELLGFDLVPTELRQISAHVLRITLGIAQPVHEYCEQLAYIISDNKKRFLPEHLGRADRAWLKIGLRESYDVIERQMNVRETKVGRRNQVLYALGAITTKSFTSAAVETKVRCEFPDSTANAEQLGVGQLLVELTQEKNPIVRRSRKSNEFEFTHPRFLMCIRAMLEIDGGTSRVMRRELV